MGGKVDIDAMRKKREESQKGSDFFQFDEGDTVLYICPPCYDADETGADADRLPFTEVHVNYGLGSTGKQMAVTLDMDRNKVLEHPALAAYLAEQGKDVAGGDPVAEFIASGGPKDKDHADRIKSQKRYAWNVIPIKHRSSQTAKWSELEPKVQPLLAGYTIWDGIMEVFGNEGDITNPDGAILVRVNRKGKDQQTKYQVHPDSETIRTPLELSEEVRKLVADSVKPGGPGDLYKIIAGMTKSRADVAQLVSGIAIEKPDKPGAETERPEGTPDGAPSCYGADIADTDPECQACEFKEGCAAVVGVSVPPDPTRKAAPAAKPAAKPAAPAAKPPVAAKPAAAPAKPAAPAAKPATPAPKAPAPAAAKPAPKPAAKPPPPSEPEPEAEEPAAEGIEAGKCEMEAMYALPDGQVGSYTGNSKGFSFFQTESGAVRLPSATLVVPAALEEEASADASATDEAPAEPAAEDEDPAIAEMERKLAAKKAAKK